ncbi:MFS transporter [Actinomadura gamaensis]|uniref:MFS transporter n=1 Tax=Actinomadura gamaensis TaxID=1763541 RepID=A0ABV9TXU2_9ACTN
MTKETRRVPDWAVLTVLCLGQGMVVLDVSIVNVALPAIRDDLGFSAGDLQWVVNAYAVIYAGFLLLGGRAADLFGRRRVFAAGLLLFTAASLVAGLAQNDGTLVAARAVQGLGGAVLSPATLTILTTTFSEGPRRAKAMGVWSAVSAGGTAVGSVLGGVLTDALDWRWVFFVNLPIGLVSLLAARRVLPATRPVAGRRLDLAGAVLVTAGLLAFVYGTIAGPRHGWGAPVTLIALIGGIALIAWFVVHEARVAREPLLAFRVLRLRSVAGANTMMFWLCCAVIAHFFFLTLYMQNVLSYTPFEAGLAFLPGAVAMSAAAYAGPALAKRVGPRALLTFGPLGAAAGLGWLALVPADGHFLGDLLVPMVLVTAGTGFAMTGLALSATAGVPREEAGLASGLFSTTRQVGGAVGLAVLAAVAAAVSGTGAATARTLTDGYSAAFATAAVFALVAVVSSAVLPRAPKAAPPVAPGPDERSDAEAAVPAE